MTHRDREKDGCKKGKKVKDRGGVGGTRKREEGKFNNLQTNLRSKEKIRYQLQLCNCERECVCVCHDRVSCQVAGRVCSDKAGAPGGTAAHHYEYLNIHTMVYHNNTLRLSFQTQISY